jgi:hypothetical protein
MVQQQATHVGRLAGMLHVVVEHRDQPHAERDMGRPPGIDHPVEIVVGHLGHQLHRLRVRLLVVLGEQAGGRGRGRDGGDLLRGVTVPVVRHFGGQPEPCRPARGRPHLRHAERGRDVVILHPGEVPDQPAHRVGAGRDLVGELLGRKPVKHVGDVFPDPPEPVDKQFRTSSHAAIISCGSLPRPAGGPRSPAQRPPGSPGHRVTGSAPSRLSALPAHRAGQTGSTLTSVTVSARRRIEVTRRSANLAGCPVWSRSTQTERSPIRVAGRMSCTQLLAT